MNKISLKDLLGQISVALDAVEADLLGATPYHSKRVAVLCLAIGRVLGYDDERLFGLGGCALLHDNALTEYILSERPDGYGKIHLKSHCVLGEENGRYVPFPKPVDGFIRYHHECADGSGAFGLMEGEFPQEAGIIALADQVDVQFKLQSLSPLCLDTVVKFISERAGAKYSASIAQAAISALDEKLLGRLSDDAIARSLLEDMPELAYEMTERELIKLSGITAKITDYKSRFTEEHTTQIANKAWRMGDVYGYDRGRQAKLYFAAAAHDIGKLFIPTSILEKAGRLSAEEFDVIKSHAIHTWEILRPVRGFEEIALWASNHHEKLDGSGYPFGKTGESLDFNSRLITCLDIYQAVRELRPYHPARGHQEAMRVLWDMAGKGEIDAGICRDMDRALKGLTDGRAPFPVL